VKNVTLQEYGEVMDAVTACTQQLSLICNSIFTKDGMVAPSHADIERCENTRYYPAKNILSILSEAQLCMVALHAYMVESNQGLYKQYAEKTWANYKA
jgi:hypothetical protein